MRLDRKRVRSAPRREPPHHLSRVRRTAHEWKRSARFHLKVNRYSPFPYATALLTTPRSRKIDALGFGIKGDVSPRGLAAAMFLERYRTALRRVKVSKDALAKQEHPPNGGNSPQNRFALLEDNDSPMDPFEAFISEEARSKCHNLREGSVEAEVLARKVEPRLMKVWRIYKHSKTWRWRLRL